MPEVDGSGQTAMDEITIDDRDLAAALEAREQARERKSEATRIFKERHDAAMGEVAKLELPDGKSCRVGRWRITRAVVKGRAVSFVTEDRTRITFGLVEE